MKKQLYESRIPIKTIEDSLTTDEMKNIVSESGGQQVLIPENIHLYNWCVKVSRNKVNESYFDISNVQSLYEKFGGTYYLLENAKKTKIQAKRRVTDLFTSAPDEYKIIFDQNKILQYEDLAYVERVIRNYYNEYMKPKTIGFMLKDHFFQRINSKRNMTPITRDELMAVFKLSIEPLRDMFIDGDYSDKFGKLKNKLTCIGFDVKTKINITFEILPRTNTNLSGTSIVDPKYTPFVKKTPDGRLEPKDFIVIASTVKRDYKFYPRQFNDGSMQAEFLLDTGLPEYTGPLHTNPQTQYKRSAPDASKEQIEKDKQENLKRQQYQLNNETNNDYSHLKDKHPDYESHELIQDLGNTKSLSANYKTVLTFSKQDNTTQDNTTHDTEEPQQQNQDDEQNQATDSQDPRVPSKERQDKITGIDVLWNDPKSPFLTDVDDKYECLDSGEFWDKVFAFLAKKGVNVDESSFIRNKFMKLVNEGDTQLPTFEELARVSYRTKGKLILQPNNKPLFNWATRVANSKFESFTKQELFSGVLYERYGGTFYLQPYRLKQLSESVMHAGVTNSDLVELEQYVESKINTHLHLKGNGQIASFILKDHFIGRTHSKRNIEPISSELMSEYFNTIIGIINQYVSRVRQIKKETEKYISILFYDRTSKVNLVVRIYYCENFRISSKITNRKINTTLTVVGTTMKRDKEWNAHQYGNEFQTDQFKHIIDLPDKFLYDGDFEEFTSYSTTNSTSLVDKDIERINSQHREFEKSQIKPTFPKLSLKKK